MDILPGVRPPCAGNFSGPLRSRVLSSPAWLLCRRPDLFSTLRLNSSYTTVLISLVLFGFGLALFAPANTSAMYGLGPAEKRAWPAVSEPHQPGPRRAQRASFLLLMTLVMTLQIN